ncbi:MFS transporter [Plantibacter sp. Mn2098]|uniref:MFS transporter n=1 Tax=Plantibacter sp. Mn2098 TaxID=3395266 RepID=UPI003BBDD9E3
MNPAVRLRRFALYICFFVPGIAMASWVTRTPAIRDLIDASTAQMGLVLLGLSIGSMTGVLSTTPLLRRFSTRPVIVVGASLIILGTAVIGLGAALTLGPVVFIGLVLFGAGVGSEEIAVNVEGAAVERLIERPVLPALHGSYSLGTVIGALIGIAFTAISFPVEWHLLLVAVIAVPAMIWAIRHIPFGEGLASADDAAQLGAAGATTTRSLLRDRRLILIGVVVLAMAFAEGSASDWLPLLMVDGHGFTATSGSLVYAGFAAAMTIGRFFGGPLIVRFGRVAVLRGSAVIAGLGLLVVIFADNPILAGLAVILWGLGASLGFPVSLSAAGDSGPDSSRRVGLAATAGYIAFLVGPPLLGFLGEHFGLRIAMLAVLVLLTASVFAAPAARQCLERREAMQES